MTTGCIIFSFRLLWEDTEALPKFQYNEDFYNEKKMICEYLIFKM